MMTRVAGVLTIVGVMTGAVFAQQRNAATAAKPIATVKELMHGIVIPASDKFFKLQSGPPSTPDEWQEARLQALTVAESSNLLLIPGRGPDQTTWNQMAQAQLDAALAAVKAADAKNVDAFDEAGNNLYDACDNCHKKYMKK